MFFLLCNRCHFGRSCGCCHAVSRGPRGLNIRHRTQKQEMSKVKNIQNNTKHTKNRKFQKQATEKSRQGIGPSGSTRHVRPFRSSKQGNAEEIQARFCGALCGAFCDELPKAARNPWTPDPCTLDTDVKVKSCLKSAAILGRFTKAADVPRCLSIHQGRQGQKHRTAWEAYEPLPLSW